MDTIADVVNAKEVRLKRNAFLKRQNMFLYILITPAVCFVVFFQYIPILGLIAAFKDYDIWLGFWNSPWAANFGLKNIIDIFKIPALYSSILNTIFLSLLNLLISFPAPIILALLFNELKNGIFKRVTQTISYMPYFLSWISVIGLTISFLDTFGPVNNILSMLLGESRERVLYLSHSNLFVPMLVFLNLWKGVGWGSILYLASMSSIDPMLYEAASIDGASRWQKTIMITLPCIAPTIAIMFILSIGGILGSNFELVFGLQNPFMNFETIDTTIYKQGILSSSYSIATAVGFTRGIVALILTLAANFITKKIGNHSVI